MQDDLSIDCIKGLQQRLYCQHYHPYFTLQILKMMREIVDNT